MISTGIIRNADNVGRVVLPKELRIAYGIMPNTPLEIFTDGDTILLRKYRPAGACAFCCEVVPGAAEFKGKVICPHCRKELLAQDGSASAAE